MKIDSIQYRVETIICMRSAKTIKMGSMKVDIRHGAGRPGECQTGGGGRRAAGKYMALALTDRYG